MPQFLVIGWPNCPYTRKAMSELEAKGHSVIFLDEAQYGSQFLSQRKEWKGNSPTPGVSQWRAPHIFQMNYVGGSSQLDQYLPSMNNQQQFCKQYLKRLIDD